MKIPSEFKVFASTINIVFDDDRLSNEGILGDCSFTDNKISICRKYRGERLTECNILDTFYHEKVHIILDSMGEHELSKNEKFVEIFSRLLRQTYETSKFNEL